jgi:small subunit ribosomal protein S6
MRTYEIIFILKPDLPEEEADRFISQMEGVVTSTGGTITKVDRMGQRRLAYPVSKYKEGNYVLFVLQCEVGTVKEFERRLRVTDAVMKFLTVRVDEEHKRLEKLQGIRAKRAAKKKPRPSPASPESRPAGPEAAPAASA